AHAARRRRGPVPAVRPRLRTGPRAGGRPMRKQKQQTIKLGPAGSAKIVVLHITCDGCQKAKFTTRALAMLQADAGRLGWPCQKQGRAWRRACATTHPPPPPPPKPRGPVQLELFA